MATRAFGVCGVWQGLFPEGRANIFLGQAVGDLLLPELHLEILVELDPKSPGRNWQLPCFTGTDAGAEAFHGVDTQPRVTSGCSAG